MNPGPAGPWQRRAPLTVLVLAAHLLLLGGGAERVGPAPALRFETRTVAQATVAAVPSPSLAPSPPAAPAAVRRRVPAQAAVPAPQAAAAAAERLPPASGEPALLTPRAVAIPGPARLRYELTVHSRGLSFAGGAILDWRHDGQEYEARLELAAPGFRGRVQRSTGRITELGLAPGYFSDRYRGEQAVHFDREQERVVFSSNRPAAALVQGMQDRLSVIVQLAAVVGGDPGRFGPGAQIAIATAGTRDAEAWIFTVEGEEELQLPGGAVQALKLQRLPHREYDQKVELWLAPGMDYAPVRLRLTNPDGGAVEQRWASTDRS